jgi:hypothetical protein
MSRRALRVFLTLFVLSAVVHLGLLLIKKYDKPKPLVVTPAVFSYPDFIFAICVVELVYVGI